MQPTTLVLTADQQQRLEAIVRRPKSQQRLALRPSATDHSPGALLGHFGSLLAALGTRFEGPFRTQRCPHR